MRPILDEGGSTQVLTDFIYILNHCFSALGSESFVWQQDKAPKNKMSHGGGGGGNT
jgi:hypothetical protein